MSTITHIKQKNDEEFAYITEGEEIIWGGV
jgi:uncharacterized cupin superfamily protein